MTTADATRYLERAQALLKAAASHDREALPTAAVELAGVLLSASRSLSNQEEKERSHRLTRLMADERGQLFTTVLTDRAFRSTGSRQTLEQCRYWLTQLGIPAFLSLGERLLMRALPWGTCLAPQLTHRAIQNQIRSETCAYISSADNDALQQYLQRCNSAGGAANLSQLGEEVLSEPEAIRRMNTYVALLERPEVRTLSVKASSLCSQLDVLSFDSSVKTLCERLRPLYRAAANAQGAGKLVYLDMESYRDSAISLAAYKSLLTEPPFHNLSAGLVLQAYLPESDTIQQELLTWATERVRAGGAPLRMRLVKGANLSTESVDSSLRGWTLPIYGSKHEVDINFKRMLRRAAEPNNLRVMHVGIASHNLFDISYALLLRARNTESDRLAFHFEVLAGMADPLVRVLGQLQTVPLIYSPIVEDEEFPSAVAYLVRRFDENTSKKNYIHHSFGIRLGDAAWLVQSAHFSKTCSADASSQPRRHFPSPTQAKRGTLSASFVNEPDTDFSNATARDHANSALEALLAGTPPLLSGRPGPTTQRATLSRIPGFDPSKPGDIPYHVELASKQEVDQALSTAASSRAKWSALSTEVRAELLLDVAKLLRTHRFELIALMVQDAAKRIDEADAEVSEAIDFAEYYALSAVQWARRAPALEPLGTIVVTPPWNFPLAIPLGGALAALVMGNTVILKPALETPRVARRAVELCWEAGIPHEALQLVICEDDTASALITDQRIDGVTLTGATATAQLFQRMRPGLRLFAETGGKNALYISAMVDREQAIADAIGSAFGHAGQKCSALSVLILHQELYDDKSFLQKLSEATASLEVGSAWELTSYITPLITPPNSTQSRALSQLEDGEQWLLEPHIDGDNPRLVSPGLRIGVSEGSWSHTREFFCPHVSIMRATDIQHALRLANSTAYGLTSGIHSLDEREQEVWARNIQTGNVYINRKITGAIVGRQPFGGWKNSTFGPGAKAGGPNYLTIFAKARTSTTSTPTSPDAALIKSEHSPSTPSPRRPKWAHNLNNADFETITRYFSQYQAELTAHFAITHQQSKLLGQDNLFSYVPLAGLFIVVTDEKTDCEELLSVVSACWASRVNWWLSASPSAFASGALGTLLEHLKALRLSEDTELTHAISASSAERVRFFGCPPPAVQQELHTKGLFIDTDPPRHPTRLELLRYHKERSLSIDYHRHGNLGMRSTA